MINWLYIYLINNKIICGASDWRRTVWPGLRLGASVSRGTAPLPRAPLRHPGSGRSHSWTMPLLHVVPGTWPLTSSLLYKHYLFFLPPGALPFFLSVCSRSVQAMSLGSKENKRVTGIFRRYTSRPGPRLTHTVANFEKFYLIYLFLTNTILNLYLSVAAPGFCLEGTWSF